MKLKKHFLQLIKFRLQKVCNQISFAVCFCDIGTIWTWKNICHALWSWKSVSLIISLDGLVWTWHNYKYLSIIQLWYIVLCTFYHPNCQICNQSLIEKSSSNFQKLFQESNLGPLPENKVDLGVLYIIFRYVVDPRMHYNFNDAGIRYFKYN